MFKLSIFAYIFSVLVILALIVIYFKERRFTVTVFISGMITLSIIAGVGILISDYIGGTQTVITTIKINDNNARLRRHKLFMRFSDEGDNRYWGIGAIDRIHYSGSVDVPVRIIYLPETRFVLGIEEYVGDIPQIPMLGIGDAKREYRQIYSNGDGWGIGCIVLLVVIFVILCT